MNRFRLAIPATVLNLVIDHARAELPNECCGFLAGTVTQGVGRVETCLPLVNERASPIAFRTEARSVLAAFRAMRAAGQELLVIYHSHPTSDPIPSRQDLAENSYGSEIPWLIVGLAGDRAEVRVWRLETESFTAVESWRE